MTVKVKYSPRVLNDHPRSTSPATRIAIPAAKATAPGRITAAGTMRGARYKKTLPAVRQAKKTAREVAPPILVAPFLADGPRENWLSSIAPEASAADRRSGPAMWFVSK